MDETGENTERERNFDGAVEATKTEGKTAERTGRETGTGTNVEPVTRTDIES